MRLHWRGVTVFLLVCCSLAAHAVGTLRVGPLEAVPGARAVVNFAPILLEQIVDYAKQLRGFLDDSGAIRDPLLAALAAVGGADPRLALAAAGLSLLALVAWLVLAERRQARRPSVGARTSRVKRSGRRHWRCWSTGC